MYNWTNNNTAIGLAASGTGNIASFVTTNNTGATISATITVTPTYTANGVSCIGTPRTYTITVNPTAVVNTITNQSLCAGANTTAVTFTSPTTGGTIVYNWTNNNTAIGLAANGTGNIASFAATNTTTAPITATITVTPTYTANSVSCIGTPRTFTITVNPTATVNTIANQSLCAGANTTAVNFTSPTTGGTIVYNWTNSNTAIGLAASGTGNIASFVATNNTTAPITATITATATYTANGVTCIGTPRTYTITVNPTATVNTIANQSVCGGANTTAVTFTSPTTGGTIVYNWTNNNTSIGLGASGTGNIASFTAINNTATPVTATITATATYTANGVTCVGTPRTFTITVNPYPVVNLGLDQTSCVDVGWTHTLNAGNAGASFLWDDNTTSQTRTVNQNGNYYVQVTNGFGCKRSDTVLINFRENPIVLLQPDTNICEGDSIYVDGTTLSAASYLWNNTATTPGIYVSATGTYVLEVTALNACINKDSVYVTVRENPIVDLGPDVNKCVDAGTLEYIDAGNPGMIYLWDNNYNGQVRVVNATGQYWVAVTNEWKCTTEDTILIILKNNPQVDLGNDTNICVENSLVLDAGTNGVSYFWNTGGTNQQYTANTAGTYYVFVTGTNGCLGSDTITVTKIGNAPKYDNIWITNQGSHKFKFTVLNPQHIIGYYWDFGDGSAPEYSSSPTHTYPTHGNYVVTLQTSSTCGIQTDTSTVHIYTLGVDEYNQGKITVEVYPNPTDGQVYLETKDQVNIDQIDVINAIGQRVYRLSVEKGKKQVSLSLSHLPSGMYQLHISTDKGSLVKKLSIAR